MKHPPRLALKRAAFLLLFCGMLGVALLGMMRESRAFPVPGGSDTGYHLLNTYHYGPAVGASGENFDYITVDSAARRVYLGRGTEVQVIDADTGKTLGLISGFKLQHGVAIAHPFNRGYITDGRAGTVTVFDLDTLKRIRTLTAQPDADCVVYDPVSRRVFTMNGDPNSSTVIDARTGKVIKTIALGGAPEFAVVDGRGMIYANLASASQIIAIDTRTLKIKARWSSAPAGHPTPLAIDTVHRRLFSAGRDPAVLDVLDADTGKVIQSFPITAGADAARYDPATGDVFVSTFAGRLHIFHEDSPDRFTALPVVTTEAGAKTMGWTSRLTMFSWTRLISGRRRRAPPDARAVPAPSPALIAS